MSEPERRKFQRHARRLPCSFRLSNEPQVGFITNVSARGFFIQTRCKAQPGEEIIVRAERQPEPPMIITGSVVRSRWSHRSMTAMEQPGFGFKVDTAPESFYQLVFDFEDAE